MGVNTGGVVVSTHTPPSPAIDAGEGVRGQCAGLRVLFLKLSGGAEAPRYCGTIASSEFGDMPNPSSVRPAAFAASETTLSERSSATWSGVSLKGPGANRSSFAWILASPNGSDSSMRRRSMVARMISMISRIVSTSGPPSS